jgi:hypothetical protein
MFLDHFNMLILKIMFFLKYYFNIFSSKKHFKNNSHLEVLNATVQSQF